LADAPGTTLAELLKRLRQAARLTQEELAEAAGISVRSVSDLERGINRTTRKETARLLCEALDLSGSARELFEAVARGRPGPNGPDVDQPAGQLPVPPTPLALALNNAGQRTQAQGDRSETIEAAWPAGKAATPDELADRIKVHDVTC
jgi:transcriptional regulator with XRE-family HTH domain